MSSIDRVVPPPPAAVRPFHFPKVERERWSNGCTLYRANYSAVPLATALLVIDQGAAREHAEQGGIARLVARTIDTGTGRRDAERLSWDLESFGAHLVAETGWDSTALMVTAPAERMAAARDGGGGPPRRDGGGDRGPRRDGPPGRGGPPRRDRR